MLAKLQRQFLIEAVKYNTLPLDDRQVERIDPHSAGRPTLIQGDTQLFFPGMGRLSENSVISIKNKSFSITAEVEIGSKPATASSSHRVAGSAGGACMQKTANSNSLQRSRHPRFADRGHRCDPTGQTPGTHGVRL